MTKIIGESRFFINFFPPNIEKDCVRDNFRFGKLQLQARVF